MDCCICSGQGGVDRSGMPGMLLRPERREDMSFGVDDDDESSDPPRGIVRMR